MTARELVNSIRNSGPNGSGIALSVTNSAGGVVMRIVPGDRPGSFRAIASEGIASLTRKEALEYVREAMAANLKVKQV
mgnify:CR=1 FL=1